MCYLPGFPAVSLEELLRGEDAEDAGGCRAVDGCLGVRVSG